MGDLRIKSQQMAKRGKYGKIIFSAADIQFIKNNFMMMTNQQIADALGLKKTTVRTKAYQMGLKRMKLEYWPDEAVEFLKANYHKIGNVEMVKLFTEKFPKDKGWTTSHIDKKMEQLNLRRSKLDWFTIKERNRDNGSFGKRNPKNNPEPPKAYFRVDAKTRIELKPGQSVLELKERYHTNQ